LIAGKETSPLVDRQSPGPARAAAPQRTRNMALYTDQHRSTAWQTLARSPLCRGLSAADVETIAQAVRSATYRGGQVICRQEEHGDRMYIIVRGRVKLSLETSGSDYRLLDYLGKGDHFGELAVLTDGRHPVTASAVTDIDVLELDEAHFERLMTAVPGLAANLSRALGFKLRWESRGKSRRHTPKVVGLVNSTLRTQGLVRPLAKALVERGNSVEVLTDRAERWPTAGDYLVERIPEELAGGERLKLVQQRLMHVVEHHDRVLLDLTLKGLDQELPALLAQCEEVWWLVDVAFADAARRNLERLLSSQPDLASRIRVVWIMREAKGIAPPSMRDLGLSPVDFKVVLGDSPETPGRGERMSIQRLVRHLQGTRIGVALGGGGARGLAHLGALRALERAGFSFDMVAGTSSGALMGLSYAAGWDPAEALGQFVEQLTPHPLLRKMPGGFHWYLWWMFRTGGWDRKLRPYLGDAMLDQLQIPLSTVAVDLISGREVVRDQGDAINAVLESINLPPISRPIMRDGMALIDGGVLNNLPGDVLVQRGADLVVGVNVVTKLRHQFAGNEPGMATPHMRKAGMVATLMRLNEVQDHGVGHLRRGAIDLLISPDTSAFEFADFSRGHGLGDAGEAAAEEAIPQLRQMLADLERG
jgi:NTE family protein